MADQQGSAESSDQGSPFSRPPFVIAAVLILVIVVLGVVVAIRVAGSDRTPHVAPPPASASSTPSTASSPASDARASVCGLPGPAGSEPSVQVPPPPAAWEYEGTTAYPTSPEFGPGEKADAGYRFCFQRSVPGAVFAAANALAPPTDAVARQAWIEYFVSTGPNHDKLLNDMQNDQASDPTGVRIKVIGFKVLSYDGSTARVDIAVEASGSGQTVTGSYVYELTWQDGDWKLNSDAPTPFNFSTVPSAAGYVPWSA